MKDYISTQIREAKKKMELESWNLKQLRNRW